MEPRERCYSKHGHNAIPSSWDIGFTEPRTLEGSVVEKDAIQNLQKVLDGIVTMQDSGSDKAMPSAVRCFYNLPYTDLPVLPRSQQTMGYQVGRHSKLSIAQFCHTCQVTKSDGLSSPQ